MAFQSGQATECVDFRWTDVHRLSINSVRNACTDEISTGTTMFAVQLIENIHRRVTTDNKSVFMSQLAVGFIVVLFTVDVAVDRLTAQDNVTVNRRL
jgi:hypothetical protein